MKSIEVKAKSVHEAIADACTQLGVDQDQVNIEILSQGGMFGKAKVLVTIKDDVVKTKTPAPTPPSAAPVIKTATAGSTPEASSQPQTTTTGTPGAKFEKTSSFVTKLLELLENDATVTTENTEKSFNINVNGPNIGRLIGKGGEVLNALQTLVSSIAISNANGEGKRVFINIADYKERRGDSLQSLAVRKAEHVKSTGRTVKLDPMNSRERAIIHTALSAIDGIKTFSTGKDPFRCLCIAPADKEKKTNTQKDTDDKKDA